MNEFLPLKDPDSLMPILSRIAFLGAVTDEQREEICKLLEVGTFRKGEYISKRGEQPSHIYIIKKGTVNLELTDDDTVIHKREFKVGDCFGEAALLSLKNNTASFVAAEESELIVLLHGDRHFSREAAFNRLFVTTRPLTRGRALSDYPPSGS